MGQIECLSPVHVGSGRAQRSDLDILRDPDGTPFIPATSFIGVLRHAFPITDESKNFWGHAEKNDGHQSALCCSDLTLVQTEPQIVVRDGIKIDNKTGLVEDKGKYDFELLEREARFQLKMEFTYRSADEQFVKQTVLSLYDLLRREQIQIGAKTNSGFGRIRLIEDATKIYAFDFSQKKDVLNWLTQNFTEQNIFVETLDVAFKLKQNCFRIAATLRLKNSLLIRSYTHDPKMPNTRHFKSGDNWLITGTGLKGAIRARAERIVNTLELKESKKIITELFGEVEDELYSKNAKKGKVKVREVILPEKDFPAELQARIKVDRFTGGVIEGGLFDSMPIFAPKEEKLISMQIEVRDYEEHEAGLMLLVLKDLWSGDLAVGGEKSIGRGVFAGVQAEIAWGDEKIILENDVSKMSAADKQKLQNFVDALREEKV